MADEKFSVSLIWKDSTEYEIIEHVPIVKSDLQFNGSVQAPEFFYYDSDTLTLELDTASDAGTHNAYFTPKDGYRWSDLTTTKITVQWTITPAVIISVPYQINTPSYDKNNHTPEFANEQSDKLTKGTVTPQKYPGNYSVSFTPKKNYVWSESITDLPDLEMPIIWSINRRIVEEPSLSQVSFSYTGGYYDVTSLISGENSYMTRSGTVKRKDRGTYWVIWTLDQYCDWKETEGRTFQILWAIGITIVPIPTAAVVSFPYDGKIHTLSVSGETDFVERHGLISRTDANRYDVWYTLKDPDSTIWSDNTTDDQYIHWEITPKSLIKPYFKTGFDPHFLYTGSKITIKKTDIVGYDQDTMIIVYDQFEGIERGTYVISYILKNSINYRWSSAPYYEEVRLVWSIGQKVVKNPYILPTNQVLKYTGSAITPIIQDQPSASLADQIGTISATDVGSHTAIFSLVQPTQYKWETATEDNNVYLPWQIIQRIVPKPTGAPLSFSYRPGIVQGPTITDSQPVYLRQTGVASETKVGDYDVTFSLRDEEGLAFSDTTDTSVTISWSIEPATVNSAFEQDGKLYYDQGRMLQPEIAGYDPRYHSRSGETEASNVGSHRIFIMPNDNYCWSDGTRVAIPVYWQIEGKGIPSPVADPSIYSYTGSAIKLHLTAETDTTGYKYITVTGDIETGPGLFTAVAALKDPNGVYFSDTDLKEIEIPWTIRVYEWAKPELLEDVFSYDQNSSLYILEKQNGEYLYIRNYNPDYMKASGDIIQINKGSYTLKIDLDHDQDIIWKDGSTDTVELPWSISGSLLTRDQSNLVQEEPLYYNGEEQRASFPDYSFLYHSAAARSVWYGTAAGTYHIYVRPQDNYSWSDGTDEERDFSWIINKRQIAKPVLIGSSEVSYSPSGYTARINGESSYYIRISGADLFNIRPGTYTRTYTITDQNTEFSDTHSSETSVSWKILADYTMPKPRAAEDIFEWRESTTFTLILAEDYDPDYVTQTGVASATSIGRYTATYVLDTTTCLWSDGTRAPVHIPWQITKQRLPEENSTFSLTEDLVYNGEVRYLRDYLQGYDPKYHTITGTNYRRDAGADLLAKIHLTDNYLWNDGTSDTKNFYWSIAKMPVIMEVYRDSDCTQQISSVDLSDEEGEQGLTTTIFVKTNIKISSASTVYRNNPTATGSTESQIADGFITPYTITGSKAGRSTLSIDYAGSNNYESQTVVLTVNVTITEPISSFSWEDLKALVEDGTIADHARVGDTIPLQLEGTMGGVDISGDYLATIIHINRNDEKNVFFEIRNLYNNDIAFVDEQSSDTAYAYRIGESKYFLEPGNPDVSLDRIDINDFSWSEIRYLIGQGAQNFFQIGDSKTIDLTGSLGGVDVAGQYKAVITHIDPDTDEVFFSLKNRYNNDIAFVDGQSSDTAYSYRIGESRYFLEPGNSEASLDRINLEEFSWSEIKYLIGQGAQNFFKIGDTKTITLTGSLGSVDIAGQYKAMITHINPDTDEVIFSLKNRYNNDIAFVEFPVEGG